MVMHDCMRGFPVCGLELSFASRPQGGNVCQMCNEGLASKCLQLESFLFWNTFLCLALKGTYVQLLGHMGSDVSVVGNVNAAGMWACNGRSLLNGQPGVALVV